MYSNLDIQSISFNMFKIHLHLFFLWLVLSFNKIESSNTLKISKPVYKTNDVNVNRTRVITKCLREKTSKFLFLSSFLLLAKPQLQIVLAMEDMAMKPKSVNSVNPMNIMPYPRIGWRKSNFEYWEKTRTHKKRNKEYDQINYNNMCKIIMMRNINKPCYILSHFMLALKWAIQK